MASAKGNGSKEAYSWRTAQANNLLTPAQINRLAGLALLCLNDLSIDYHVAAHELGSASPNAVRTAISDIKKKLREGGAILGASSTPSSPTKLKAAGGKKGKKKRVETDDEEEEQPMGTPKKKVKTEIDKSGENDEVKDEDAKEGEKE